MSTFYGIVPFGNYRGTFCQRNLKRWLMRKSLKSLARSLNCYHQKKRSWVGAKCLSFAFSPLQPGRSSWILSGEIRDLRAGPVLPPTCHVFFHERPLIPRSLHHCIIQGILLHCKHSGQEATISRRSLSDVNFCFISSLSYWPEWLENDPFRRRSGSFSSQEAQQP